MAIKKYLDLSTAHITENDAKRTHFKHVSQQRNIQLMWVSNKVGNQVIKMRTE